MKKVFILASMLLLSFGCKRGPTLEGNWKATATTGILAVTLDLHVKPADGGKFTGTLDIPELKQVDAKLDNITLTEGAVEIAAGQGGTFKGKLSEDGNTIEGNWTLSGMSFPLSFKKAIDAK